MAGSGGLGFSGNTGGALGLSGNTGGQLGFAGTTGGITGMARPGVGFVGGAGGITIPSTTNPFRATYADAYALGYAGGTGQAVFGQPVTGATTTGYTGQVMTGLGGAGAPGGIVFGSSFGVRRAPAYATTIGFPYRLPSGVQLQSDLQGVINRSEALAGAKDNIRVAVTGRLAVLQGAVATPHDRRLAEALVRLEPGVADVQNDLVVSPPRP
jgi:hypothetical protein